MPLPTARAASAVAAPALLSTREAADYLGVSLSTLRRLVAERSVRHYKPGGQLRFDPADLDAYVRSSVREPVR